MKRIILFVSIILISRYSIAQRVAINEDGSAAAGLLVFDPDNPP